MQEGSTQDQLSVVSIHDDNDNNGGGVELVTIPTTEPIMDITNFFRFVRFNSYVDVNLFLIKYKAEANTVVNTIDETGSTAMHWAAKGGDPVSS